MIDTLETKVLRGVSVFQQQQQRSIDVLTNISIKTSIIPGIIVNLLF